LTDANQRLGKPRNNVNLPKPNRCGLFRACASRQPIK
jgi:hypothetical protein